MQHQLWNLKSPWKRVPLAYLALKQLLQNKFVHLSSGSMSKCSEGEKKWKIEWKIMILIVATTSLPFNCLMATNCKAASHAPFIYVFNIGVISNNTNRLWREFSIKQMTEIVINIFLTTKEQQSIRTIHILRHTGCEWGWRGGSLHHDGNTDIVMGGTCRPSEGRKISLQWCQVNCD